MATDPGQSTIKRQPSHSTCRQSAWWEEGGLRLKGETSLRTGYTSLRVGSTSLHTGGAGGVRGAGGAQGVWGERGGRDGWGGRGGGGGVRQAGWGGRGVWGGRGARRGGGGGEAGGVGGAGGAGGRGGGGGGAPAVAHIRRAATTSPGPHNRGTAKGSPPSGLRQSKMGVVAHTWERPSAQAVPV